MLISERKLRGIVKQAILESFGTEYGSGSSDAAPASTTVNGGGGYSYEIFPDGKVQIVSKNNQKLPVPTVLNQKQAMAVAAEQIKLGNKDPIIAQIAGGKLIPGAAVAQPAAVGPVPNLILVARQDFFPLDNMLGLTKKSSESSFIGALIKQGHAFVIVVDPKTRLGHRYDFGRYTEAKNCKDDRMLSKAAEAAGLGGILEKGIHTMGITMYVAGRVPANISPDGKQITNLPQFLASFKSSKDSPGQVAVITVKNAAAAKAYADGMKGKCFPYALPGLGALTTADTMNCGVFATRVLNAGAPNPPLAIDEGSLVETPDAMYKNAEAAGYQTSPF